MAEELKSWGSPLTIARQAQRGQALVQGSFFLPHALLRSPFLLSASEQETSLTDRNHWSTALPGDPVLLSRIIQQEKETGTPGTRVSHIRFFI